ncbi:hypothetical protein L1987_57519 [Smallanthus sonchifolius]|uniref:Uncharacterized protein n=1 Tax=Smallanthus sonchifolius TaxID=185202 RepID=A0ACB9DCV0_9ASTR|nr:hypothetical protein L1987_57519 [Smallanthus sonchifolius]
MEVVAWLSQQQLHCNMVTTGDGDEDENDLLMAASWWLTGNGSGGSISSFTVETRVAMAHGKWPWGGCYGIVISMVVYGGSVVTMAAPWRWLMVEENGGKLSVSRVRSPTPFGS